MRALGPHTMLLLLLLLPLLLLPLLLLLRAACKWYGRCIEHGCCMLFLHAASLLH